MERFRRLHPGSGREPNTKGWVIRGRGSEAYKKSVTAESLRGLCRRGRNSRREGAEPVIRVCGRLKVGPCRFGDSLGRLKLEGASDEVLMLRVTESGDEWALSELYDRYGGLVYSAGMQYLVDRRLAEDLVQDVFFSVWRNAASFDPSKASFSTWIFRITRNRAIDLVRRRRARVRAVVPIAGEGAFPEPSEDDATEEILRGFDVAGALSQISPAHREVLVLAYFEGLSQREISRRTGIPLGTVKSRTTAALRAMRRRLLVAKTPNDPRKGTSKDRWSRDG